MDSVAMNSRRISECLHTGRAFVHLDVDVLRRVEGEVELETARGVASGSNGRRSSRRSRSLGGRRSSGAVRDLTIVVIAAALELEDDRTEQRKESKLLRHLHLGDNEHKSRAGVHL